MKKELIITIKERINELRAKQHWHSIQEERKALEIQNHIREESRLEDLIMEWEVQLDKMKGGQDELKRILA